MTLRWREDDPAGAAALEPAVTTEHLLVALDFDGTLALLYDEPMSARAEPEAAAAVRELLRTPDTTVAFVSGRSLHDLREIAEHGDDSPIHLAGSHGAEFWSPGVGVLPTPDDEAAHGLRDELRDAAASALSGFEGIWLEPKTFGFGVHTRRATPADEAEAWRIVDALVQKGAPHWRRRQGHNIVEYSFRHEGKDSAIAALRERLGASAVLFAGDDVTDEDAIRTLHDPDVGVRVGEGETAASLRVADPRELAALLFALARTRRAARE